MGLVNVTTKGRASVREGVVGVLFNRTWTGGQKEPKKMRERNIC